MLWIRLFHLLKGYVLFTAAGGFPERFVNLCAGMRIPVWDVKPVDGVLYGKTRVRDYRRLRAAARRAGMHLRIHDKKGVPFFLHRHRSRFGLLAAAAIFFALLGVLSTRIWIIDVDSGNAWTRETVRMHLREIGVQEGIRASGFDATSLERELLLRMPDMEWVALNVRGAALHVELRAAEVVPPAEDYAHPCHIVASKDGFLRRLEVYEGSQTAQVRTAVQKGQLLISGTVEHTNGSVTLHHAKGYAEAETTQTVCVALPQTCAFPTVKHARFRIGVQLFSVRLPLGDPRPAEKAAYFVYDRYSTAGDFRLPLTCTVFRNLFFEKEKPLSAGQKQLLLLSDFGEQAVLKLRASQIIRADVTLEARRCAGTFHTLENIGMEQDVLTDFSGTEGNE